MPTITSIKRTFKIIEQQVSQLVEQRYIFRSLQEYSLKNKLNAAPVYYEFLRFVAFNYRDLSVVNVYKQVDDRDDVISFINLLNEIKESSNLFTQSWFVKNYPVALKEQAVEDFKQFKGRSGISRVKVEADIKDLRKAVRGRKSKAKLGTPRETKNSLAKVRHKRGAHYANSAFDSKASTDDLYQAIELMENLVLKYNCLLNQSGMDTLLASNIDEFIQFDKIFKQRYLNAKMIQSDPQKHYEWCIMPQIYMATALKMAKEILPASQEFKQDLYSGDICKEIGFVPHANYYFIYPIVYNFKHGVEMWIKGLGNIDYGEFQGSHDLLGLFDLAIQKATNNKAGLEQLKKETWPMIEKYYFGTYIPLNTTKDKPDFNNEAERYPEAKNKFVYSIPTNYHWIDYNVISGVISDIEFVNEQFHKTWVSIKPSKDFKY